MKTLIIAHRGASKQAPENTIPAFKLAIQQNADGIEGDFRLTKDGEIVCIHDALTKRVGNVNKVVQDLTLDELKQIDVGKWFSKDWQGLTIPTLTEVLEILPKNKKLFIEVKCGVEIVPSLLSILNNNSTNKEQIVIISFDSEVLKAIKNSLPSIKTLFLSSFKGNYLTSKLIPSVEKVLEILTYIKADGFSSQAHKLLDEKFINKIMKAGYEYHVWTVDDIAKAQKFMKMGVNSITTNTPSYLIEELSNIKFR